MAVMVECGNPQELLSKIRSQISSRKIETWSIDGDGDLTHEPEQWRYLAWFRPSVEPGKLAFYILGAKSKKMTKAVYGVYHGRLIEMLLTHFDGDFVTAQATAMPRGRDQIGSSA